MCSELTFSPEDFPYLTAELGGGLQPTEHRRPVPTGTDIGAMSLAKLGSGVAMLGYYMYHGGSNPKGKFSTLQESKESGYPNNVPVVNYDFFAPIRQYGQISESYKEIKLLAMFLADFGDDMAKLPEEIAPADISPEDTHSLRTSWRHDDKHGYVFKQRAVQAADILVTSVKEANGPVLLMGHGVMNRLIAKELVSMGWKEYRRLGNGYWSAGIYSLL